MVDVFFSSKERREDSIKTDGILFIYLRMIKRNNPNLWRGLKSIINEVDNND